VFGCFLGLGFFDSPEGPLVHKQASLRITFDGIGPISTSIIALIVYLRSWILVILVIAAWFMNDQRPFLFEVLARVDNNTCFF
jgi:hypothetical protein